MIDNLFNIIFLMAFLFLADFYFIGFVPLLFGNDLFFNPRKIQCHYKIVAQIIDTDCHDINRNTKRIVKFFDEINSRISICDEGIFVGRKYLSYAYKLKYDEINEVNLKTVRRFLFNIANLKITINNKKGECFYLIKYFTITSRENKKANNIINFIKENVDKKRGQA